MGFILDVHVDVTFGVIPHRYYVCVLSWIGLTICYVMRFCLSFAITEMVEAPEKKFDPDGCETMKPPVTSSSVGSQEKQKWSSAQQGVVLSSFFWGYVLTQVPAGHLADLIGPRRVMFLGALATSIFTAITPLLLQHGGIYGMVAIRVLVGLVQGCFYAGLHTVVALWVPIQERGFWGTLVFSGSQSGNFVTALSSGLMLAALRPNWEYLFYIWGSVGFVWSMLFFLTTFDNYLEAPKVSEKESTILANYFEEVSKKERIMYTPWKAIGKSLPVWALILGQIGHDYGLYIMVVDVPLYMNQVLRFDIKENGLYVSLGWLSLFILALASGQLVDLIQRRGWLTRTWNRIVFTTIASVGPSIGMLGTSYSHCFRVWAVVCLVFGMTTMGTYYPSLKINPIDLAPNHAGTIGAIGNGIGSLTGIAVPSIVGAMTPNATWLEWNYVWWVNFVVMTLTNVFYIFFASGEEQPWNKEGIEAKEQ